MALPWQSNDVVDIDGVDVGDVDTGVVVVVDVVVVVVVVVADAREGGRWFPREQPLL